MSHSTSFPGFSAPAAGFEAPLEMLAACHGRIERQCATLRRLAAHLADRPGQLPDMEARGACGSLLRYFDTAAVHHHHDEERDLFPALLEAMAGSDAVCIRDLAARLTAEHRELEAAWRGLRPSLEKIAAGDRATLDAQAAGAFARLYEAHLAVEEAELLPMAARLLDGAQLEEIGRAMRHRRGVDAP
jgi:hemerythrin-like domain-containing protein